MIVTLLDPSSAKVLRQPLVSVDSQLSLVKQIFRSEKCGKNHNRIPKSRKEKRTKSWRKSASKVQIRRRQRCKSTTKRTQAMVSHYSVYFDLVAERTNSDDIDRISRYIVQPTGRSIDHFDLLHRDHLLPVAYVSPIARAVTGSFLTISKVK
jgi:hypothetical protein